MTEYYDNRILKVNGAGLERLKVVMSLSRQKKAMGYYSDRKTLVFYSHNYENQNKKIVPFPVPMSLDRCAEIAIEWLESADYGQQPDHDGDNKKGWLCYTDYWGYVDEFGWESFLAVKPDWLMIGK